MLAITSATTAPMSACFEAEMPGRFGKAVAPGFLALELKQTVLLKVVPLFRPLLTPEAISATFLYAPSLRRPKNSGLIWVLELLKEQIIFGDSVKLVNLPNFVEAAVAGQPMCSLINGGITPIATTVLLLKQSMAFANASPSSAELKGIPLIMANLS
jgi:hypothetical protein